MKYLVPGLCRSSTILLPIEALLGLPHTPTVIISTAQSTRNTTFKMFYAWLLFAGYYVTTSILTGWVLSASLGTQNIVAAIAFLAVLQLLRAVPGLPSTAVRYLNYHVMLTGYRLNYL